MSGLSILKFGMVCWCDRPVSPEEKDNSHVWGERPAIIVQNIPISMKKVTILPLGGKCVAAMDENSGLLLEEGQCSYMKPYDIGPCPIKYLRPLGMLSDDDIDLVKEVIAQYFGITAAHDVLNERIYFRGKTLRMSMNRNAPYDWNSLSYRPAFSPRCINDTSIIEREMFNGTYNNAYSNTH